MAGFKIQAKPTFKQKVSLPIVGDEPMVIDFTYKYVSKKDLAKLQDSWAEQFNQYYEKVNTSVKEGTNLTNIEWTEDEISLQVKQIKDIVLGWGFDDEFSDENIYNLCDTLPGTPNAIVAAYLEAYAKTREAK